MTSDIDALVIDLIRDNRRYPGAMTHKQLHAGDILKIEAGPRRHWEFRLETGTGVYRHEDRQHGSTAQ